ncbi:hypothetical protein AAIA72_03420 [Hahella sp. SMD15-11]|uniref:ABC transporter substrate-binding protein n=1 Tax=Thermohahella caldifontis TaxID=3142973 RepID=A0AB39UXW9_9GAMM
MVSQNNVGALADQVAQLEDVRIVALGQEALKRVSAALPKVPTLGVFIRKASYEKLSALPPFRERQHSVIYLESPPERQLNLISILLPRAKTVAVLVPADKPLAEWPKHPALSVQSFTLRNQDELPRILSRALNSADALLATPEPEIYNRNLIKLILLSAYRHGKPVVGPSLAYVRAGSLATTFSSIGDFSREIIEALEFYKKHGFWPRPGYARYFSVAVNRQVARSLGLNPPSDDMLRHELERMEATR